VSFQVSVIVDSRDNEFVPTRGVVAEAGASVGAGGDGYTGAYAVVAGYVPPWPGAVVAARLLARRLDAGAPLDARYVLNAWERAIPLLGGPGSHRSFLYGRWAGREVFLANLELRQDVFNFGDYGAISLVGFLDAGRVREGLAGEPHTVRLGGGSGIALRILRSTVLQFNFAGGPDGFLFSMGTGWTF
jgi:outer membrane protein assembly factor BamA